MFNTTEAAKSHFNFRLEMEGEKEVLEIMKIMKRRLHNAYYYVCHVIIK